MSMDDIITYDKLVIEEKANLDEVVGFNSSLTGTAPTFRSGLKQYQASDGLQP